MRRKEKESGPQPTPIMASTDNAGDRVNEEVASQLLNCQESRKRLIWGALQLMETRRKLKRKSHLPKEQEETGFEDAPLESEFSLYWEW